MDYYVDICVFYICFSIFLLQCRSASLPRVFAFHFRNVTLVTSREKCFEFVPGKKLTGEELEDIKFLGVSKK